MEVKVEGKPLETKVNDQAAPRGEVPLAKNEDVLNTKVGSEAAVASGLQPVPGSLGGIADATKVHNADLRKRDEEENKRRGRRGPLPEEVSLSWTGLMMVEVDGEKPQPKSGSFSGAFAETLTLRRPTQAEIEELTESRGVEPRGGADKTLVKGSGTGGGGNPMHAGNAAGVTSRTADVQANTSGVRTSRN